MKCGKEINNSIVVPDFNWTIENKEENVIIHEEMQFICKECSNKRYEQLKEIFNGKNTDI